MNTAKLSVHRFMVLTFAAMLGATAVHAETITEKNAEKAAAIIDAAIAAHGGEIGLDAVETLVVEHESVNYLVDQSRGTEAPWDTSRTIVTSAIDLDNGIFAAHTINEGASFQGNARTIINGDDSFQLDYRAGTSARIEEPDFATTSGPFVRVTSLLLVKSLQQRRGNAHYLGEATLDGKAHDVIGFSMTVGPAISLYFDQEDHLLRRSERIFPGFGLVHYVFEDYETMSGIPFNRNFRFYVRDDLNLKRKNKTVAINQPLDEHLAVDDSLVAIAAIPPDPVARHEIADGVWQIGGNGTYAMFVDMGDYVFAAGGTAGIAERIELLREVVGDKPVRYGMLTHHHADHVLGVADYETEGATIVAAAAHEKIARAAAADGAALKVKTVNEVVAFETEDRELQVIDIGPTAHTEHLLVAWLPEEGILFEADHFTLPASGPIPPAVNSTRTFAEALRRMELPVQKILTAHSAKPATPEDLAMALEAEVFQASR